MGHSGNGNEQAVPAPNPTTVVNSVMPGLPAQMPASSGNANTDAQGWYENYQNMGWSTIDILMFGFATLSDFQSELDSAHKLQVDSGCNMPAVFNDMCFFPHGFTDTVTMNGINGPDQVQRGVAHVYLEYSTPTGIAYQSIEIHNAAYQPKAPVSVVGWHTFAYSLIDRQYTRTQHAVDFDNEVIIFNGKSSDQSTHVRVGMELHPKFRLHFVKMINKQEYDQLGYGKATETELSLAQQLQMEITNPDTVVHRRRENAGSVVLMSKPPVEFSGEPWKSASSTVMQMADSGNNNYNATPPAATELGLERLCF
jgi:hypothetical protein